MQSYAEQFASLTQNPGPHRYQELLADYLLARRHVIVRAPTGAGKTLAVLIPFLLYREQMKFGGMIYVLPLRTLVEAVFEEAKRLSEPRGLKVVMQTGERADAEFFHDADIIVTTFDQLLSGLLCDPYGLSRKLWNINAAAIAGKLVIFDEFHLMEPHRAFVSALFGVQLFRELCVSVWMTATATSTLVDLVVKELDATEVELSNEEQTMLFEGRGIHRELQTHWGTALTTEEIIRHRGRKMLVVVNTVKRAQDLLEALPHEWPALLLHSRFFSTHRREKQSKLRNAELVIATQVIEAGVDMSCEVLLTEIAPVNAIVQRAGRCARFANESGTVHVYDTSSALPYAEPQLNAARRTINDSDTLNPRLVQAWVEQAHGEEDRKALIGFRGLVDKRRDFIRGRVTGHGDDSGAAAYIRTGDDTVRVFILANPAGVRPQERESIQVRRRTIQGFQRHGWVYEGDEWISNGDFRAAYAVALPPSIAGYTKERGLKLGSTGIIESPTKKARERPGWQTLLAELWGDHTQNVIRCAHDRMRIEGLPECFIGAVTWAAKLHDVGKLQDCWQKWARGRQAVRGKEVEGTLAHTDYDRILHRGEPRPPKHAAASALYGAAHLRELPDAERSAILLALLTHHGGTMKGVESPDRLHATAIKALESVGLRATRALAPSRFVSDESDNIWDFFEQIWPLTAILSRILRLSDQKATAESSNE